MRAGGYDHEATKERCSLVQSSSIQQTPSCVRHYARQGAHAGERDKHSSCPHEAYRLVGWTDVKQTKRLQSRSNENLQGKEQASVRQDRRVTEALPAEMLLTLIWEDKQCWREIKSGLD